MTPGELARFQAKVAEGPDGPLGRCLIWVAATNSAGYGVMRAEGGTLRLAHVLAYEHDAGAVLPGLEIDHLCGVKACVNRRHLEAVSHRENLRRACGLDRLGRCARGHAAVPSNLYRAPDGRLSCQTCRRDVRRARARVRAAA